MRFTKFLAAFMLTGSAVAASPDATEVLRSFNVTAQRIVALNQTVSKFSSRNPCNLDNAFAVQVKVNQIVDTLNYITKIAKATKGVFDFDSSSSIAVAVVNLEDPIRDSLANVIRNKKYFTKAVLGFGDLSATVRYDLKLLFDLVDTVGKALEPHIVEDLRSFVPSLVAEVQALFDPARKEFATCGRVCLPIITLRPGDGSVPGQYGGSGYGYGH